MRRNIWLAGAAGAVIGSWLTLVAVQVNEHGFHLPGRAASKVEAEPRPAAAAAPIEMAQADVTPAQTLSDTAPKKTLPITAGTVTPTATVTAQTITPTATKNEPPAATSISAPAVAEDAAKDAVMVPTDQDKSSAATPATEPQGTPSAQLTQSETTPAKVTDAQPAPKDATDADTIKTEADKAEPEQSPSKQVSVDQPSPQQAPADQTKPEPAAPPPAPADQADRAAAAAAHRTVPMAPSSQQASPGDSQMPSDEQKQAGGTEPVELVRPSSDRAGTLTVGNRSVQLFGIIPTDIGRMCAGSDGKNWPCGTAARTAFRMYLRGRIIDCDLPSATWQGTVTGNCRYVRIDLSEWLVRFGWAEPEAGSPLEAVAEQAKQQKRGIYGDDPRKGRKSTLAPAPAKEDPLNPI
jgi:endonuclease YncB( thermonuclease family)